MTAAERSKLAGIETLFKEIPIGGEIAGFGNYMVENNDNFTIRIGYEDYHARIFVTHYYDVDNVAWIDIKNGITGWISCNGIVNSISTGEQVILSLSQVVDVISRKNKDCFIFTTNN